ncbi:MAG: YggS family pyridoxal phosphate-dependent enzyme [Chitinispirillales bacterium]|jgi:pyridoxal phosphate enzyme (YggS family)|nr:YggS family pyridoxal phosphate-dependent enzyme [Chitinispirillales bacterium]
MMDAELSQRLSDVRERIETACQRAGRPAGSVRLIAVTKNHPVETLQKLIDMGVRDIGENRVQEIEIKAPRLTGDFTLHMIGHLQTNKARKVWPLAEWIHSVDRDSLVQKLGSLHNTETTNCLPPRHRPKKILIEVNTTGEPSKSGCAPSDCQRLCDLVAQTGTLELHGLMTIGPLNGDERAVRKSFSLLRELSQKHCTEITAPELSMGMSSDFEWAIEEGATMVRIGTTILDCLL